VNDFNQGGVIVTRDQRAEALEAKRRFWGQHIERWKRSGLKQSSYCRRHELKLHCFTYWRKKVRRTAPAPVSLVEVRLPPVATTEAIVTTGHRPAAGGLLQPFCGAGARLRSGGPAAVVACAGAAVMFLPSHTRIYLATGGTDMRKAINGLSILVEDRLRLDPFSGHLFAFCNRCRNMVRILYWDRNGFCLWHKRLEKQFFTWPDSVDQTIELDIRQLRWLLEGLKISQIDGHNKLDYKTLI
jgi:transposase